MVISLHEICTRCSSFVAEEIQIQIISTKCGR